MIDQTAGWIRHADAKIAILTAAAGITAGALGAGIPDAVVAARAETPWSGLIAFLSATSLATAILTGVFVVLAIVARTQSTSPGNRFSWPDLASNGWKEGAPDAHVEAKAQAAHLARLASIKFRHFNRAFSVFVVLLTLTALTLIVISIGGP